MHISPSIASPWARGRGDEIIGLARLDARLLRLGTRVHLHIRAAAPALLGDFLREFARRSSRGRPSRSRRTATIRARNTTCSRCSPIRRGASTWAMCATTRWATWWRATSARARASTCCTRWAGTPSAAGRERRDAEQGPSRAPGPTTTSRHARPAQVDGPVARLGARIRDLRPAYYRHQQKLFLDFWKAGPRRAQESKVNWDPVDRPCSPTSR
jgi:hypothetical protein